MKRLKMAVVGVGALGRHHARILSELQSVELIAVADTDPQRGRPVAEQCRTRWVPDCADLLDQVEAVSIVVPTSAHRAVASRFLQHSIPVLIEKPLAGTLRDAEALARLAEENNTLLQVGHIERFNPATQTAWSLCGPPKYIRAERLSGYSFRSTDIGVVHDLMIHDIDLVLDLVRSPVRKVEAFGIGIIGGHEDAVQARITFENGCVADLTASRVNPAADRSMQIWSARGVVTVDFTSREVTSYRPSAALLSGPPVGVGSLLERAARPGTDVEQLKADVFGKYIEVEQPRVPPADALTAELAHFAECVLQQKRPLVGGPEALAAMQIADAVLQRVANHQWDGHAEGPLGPFLQPSQPRKMAG